MTKASTRRPSDPLPWQGGLEFRTLAETIPSLVFVTDAAGQNIYTNVQFQRYTGLASEALNGDGWLAAIHAEDRIRAEATWRESCQTGVPYDTRYRFRRYDGDYRWHIVRGVPIRDTSDDIVRWMGNCTDVDEMMTAIESKSQASAILSAFGRAPGLILYAKDAAGRFVIANEATLSTVGMTSDQLLGLTVEELGGEAAYVEVIRHNDDQALRTGTPAVFDEAWFTGQGPRHYRSIKAPFVQADGALGIAAATYDVTDEKWLAERLQAAEHRLDAWLAALPLIAWEADSNGRITTVSQAWRDASGVSVKPDEYDFAELIVPGELILINDAWRFAVENGEIMDVDATVFDHLERRNHRVNLRAYPMELLARSIGTGWIGIMRTV